MMVKLHSLLGASTLGIGLAGIQQVSKDTSCMNYYPIAMGVVILLAQGKLDGEDNVSTPTGWL